MIMLMLALSYLTDKSPLVTLPSSDGLSMRISIPALDVVDTRSSFSFLILSRGEARGEMRGEALGDGLGDALGDAFGVPFGDLDFFLSFVFSLLEFNFASSSALISTSFSSSGESGVAAAGESGLVRSCVDLKGLKLTSR